MKHDEKRIRELANEVGRLKETICRLSEQFKRDSATLQKEKDELGKELVAGKKQLELSEVGLRRATEERAKALEEKSCEKGSRESLEIELTATKNSMDWALANLNGQLAEEKGKAAKGVEERDILVVQVGELENKMQKVVERSVAEKKVIAEEVTVDALKSCEESKLSALFGVQLLYGSMYLSSLELEEDHQALEGFDVYIIVDKEKLMRLMEELGVDTLGTVVPLVPATPVTPGDGLVDLVEKKTPTDDVSAPNDGVSPTTTVTLMVPTGGDDRVEAAMGGDGEGRAVA